MKESPDQIPPADSPSFVPWNEVESDRLKIAIQIPDFVDTEKIGVNLAEIERLCDLAGIKEIIIKPHKIDQDNPSPIVIGHTGGGEALGGFVNSSIKTNEMENQPIPLEVKGLKPRIQSILQIGVDMEALKEFVVGSEEGLRSVKVWADKFDSIMKDSLSSAGRENLLSPNFGLEFLTFIYPAYVVLNTAILLNVTFIKKDIKVDSEYPLKIRERIEREWDKIFLGTDGNKGKFFILIPLLSAMIFGMMFYDDDSYLKNHTLVSCYLIRLLVIGSAFAQGHSKLSVINPLQMEFDRYAILQWRLRFRTLVKSV